jgi:hypothetical protein
MCIQQAGKKALATRSFSKTTARCWQGNLAKWLCEVKTQVVLGVVYCLQVGREWLDGMHLAPPNEVE